MRSDFVQLEVEGEKIMANEKASFREFLTAVEPKHRAFVEKLNYWY